MPPPAPPSCKSSVPVALGSGKRRLATPLAMARCRRSARAAATMAATRDALSSLSSAPCTLPNGGAVTEARHSGHVRRLSAQRDQQLKCNTCAHGCRMTAGPLISSLSALRQTEHVSCRRARAFGPTVIDMLLDGTCALSEGCANAVQVCTARSGRGATAKVLTHHVRRGERGERASTRPAPPAFELPDAPGLSQKRRRPASDPLQTHRATPLRLRLAIRHARSTAAAQLRVPARLQNSTSSAVHAHDATQHRLELQF